MILYLAGLCVLAVYTFLISVQFGSGIFLGLFGYNEARSKVILKYLSPVTGVTNTFLVVYALLLISGYPMAPMLYGTTLLVPVMIGIIFLGLQVFALLYLGLVQASHRGYRLLLAVSSLLAPIFLMSYFAVSFRNDFTLTGSSVEFSLRTMLSDPLYLWLILLGLMHIAYFTAMFFSYHPREERVRNFFTAIRRILAVTTPVLTFFWLWQFRDLYVVNHLITASWWLLGIAILGYGLAVSTAAAWLHIGHFLVLFIWYVVGMYPFIMYPHIRVSDTTNPIVYHALVWGLAGGLVILIPSLIYLGRIIKAEYAD